MDLQLYGKVALVTGGSRGLGLASARALVAEGCHVAICARGAERLEQAADELRAAAAAGAEVSADRRGLSTARRRRRASSTRRRRTSAASTCSSTTSGWRRAAGSLDTTDEVWQEAFDQTLFPAIRASRAAVPHCSERGGGAIVIISSIFGREAGGRMTYNAVKAAEISLTKSLAQQLAKDNIRVVDRRARVDPVSRRLVARAAAGRSGGHRRLRRAASCRSAASADPRKSATWSPSSPRHAPAGSAGRQSSSTGASRGCSDQFAASQFTVVAVASSRDLRMKRR